MSGPASSLALRFLQREHEEIDVLLGELMAGTGDLVRARRLVCERLEQHMTVEEKVFYPALARMEMLGAFIDRMHDQHRVVRECLEALREVEPGQAGFAAAVRRLDDAVDRHIQDEEQRGFAYAAEHLAGELDTLAVEMEAQRDAQRGAFGVG